MSIFHLMPDIFSKICSPEAYQQLNSKKVSQVQLSFQSKHLLFFTKNPSEN